jgi:hypothetical protein
MPAHGALATGGFVAPGFALDPNAANNGVLGWTSDPLYSTVAANFTPVAATIYLFKIPVPRSITITNLLVAQVTAGTSYTNAQMGLYNSSGTYLAASAVQASAGTNGFGVNTAMVTLALDAAQTINGGPNAFVWVGLHMGTNAVTSAIFRAYATSNYMVNLNCSTSTLRCATYTGHATNNLATIGNLTPTSMSSTGNAMWYGLS